MAITERRIAALLGPAPAPTPPAGAPPVLPFSRYPELSEKYYEIMQRNSRT